MECRIFSTTYITFSGIFPPPIRVDNYVNPGRALGVGEESRVSEYRPLPIDRVFDFSTYNTLLILALKVRE